MRSPICRLITFIIALSLCGCSGVRLGYDNADSLARWWIDKHLDLTPAQDLLARDGLSRLHAWHRKTQLPEYLGALRQGQRLITGQPTVADVLAMSDEIVRHAGAAAEKATPDIADFLLTVTPPQVERMIRRQDEKNADFAKEAGLAEGEAGQRKARYKRVLEQAEYWFDDFDSEQKAALRKLIDGQPVGARFHYDERLRRQSEWVSLIREVQRERPPREQIVQRLRHYAAHFDMPADPALAARAKALRRNSAELAVAIHALTSPAQRAYAGHKLDELARDITELARKD